MRKLLLVYFPRFSSLLLVLAFFPLLTMADNRLPELVVTATRTAKTVDDSLASVTVITRKEIDNSQALTVPEILRSVLGLDMSIQGGYG